MNQPLNHERIRLVLLDDHVLYRESLARLLEAEADLELVAECARPSEAIQVLSDKAVDVILLSLESSHSSDENAEGFMLAARHAGYIGKFLIVTADIEAFDAALVLKRGASGIFLESKSASSLLSAIRMVAGGEAWLDQRVVQLLAEHYSGRQQLRFNNFTDREQAVLEGVLDGLTSKKIAMRIGVSEATIKGTLQQLFATAGVRTRSQLVRAAMDGTLRRSVKSPTQSG